MKITFTPPNDGKAHTYCPSCLREKLQPHRQAGKLFYRCTACAYVGPRALIVDPIVSWWVDDQQQYWHETGGIFVYNQRHEFLFFERMAFPFGLTVPAGHVDHGEPPARTARRELFEETGVSLPQRAFTHIATDDIHGDQCRRGADIHRWHSFACALPPSAPIKVDPREGARPVWLGLQQALASNLTPATRFVITHHARRLARAAAN